MCFPTGSLAALCEEFLKGSGKGDGSAGGAPTGGAGSWSRSPWNYLNVLWHMAQQVKGKAKGGSGPTTDYPGEPLTPGPVAPGAANKGKGVGGSDGKGDGKDGGKDEGKDGKGGGKDSGKDEGKDGKGGGGKDGGKD